MAVPKAIPQEHKGIVFRSRTEARWAEFFRLTKTPFQYEPEGYQLGNVWYVPDFLLNEAEAFFEVKGGSPTLPERHKAMKLARQLEQPVLIGCGNPSVNVEVLCFTPDGRERRCVIVEEHKTTGAWVAEFADGGGWAFPLKKGLVNCAAYGYQHPSLDEAGKLQFNVPDPDPPPPVPDLALGDWEIAGRWAWPLVKGAWQRMKKGETT
jgi:hypothetical protein